jgi:FKBP-type peptidyl-prolyl cis-trans isomerase (trigger factor)
METEVRKIDDTKKEISVKISGEIVKNKFEDVFKKIGQEAKVAGFRPGHVPRDILEKNFAASANEQVLKELIPDIYNQAIEKEAIDAIDMPDISEVKLDRNSLSFKAAVEIKPEIHLVKYKGIKLNYKKIEVGADDVKRSLDSLKESKKIDNLDDAFAKGLGYPSLLNLEKFLEAQIYIQKQNQERKKLEDTLIETIMKDLDFKAPQSLVNRQVQELIRQTKMDMAIKGVPREKIEEHDKALTEQCAAEAKSQVRMYLVLSEIAKKENIPQDDHMPNRVIEFLFKEAEWTEQA